MSAHLRNKRPWKQKVVTFLKQGGKCAYCRCHMALLPRGKRPLEIQHVRCEATWDHIVPVSSGGRSDRDNLTLACWDCNSRKGSKTAQEFQTSQQEHTA